MKKLFTIDDFMVAFISALGYGFGEAIAKVSGWSEIMCGLASFALGVVLQGVISKIVFSKGVQKSRTNRILIYIAIFLVFLTAQYISSRWMGVSLLSYLHDEFVFVVLFPILGFVFNLLIGVLRVQLIRKRYGDGSGGYVFDLKDKDIEETNRQNQPILGKYDESLAVKTRTGVFVGQKVKKNMMYLGIPYAKPPVGELRWKAPEPLPDSDAVFEAENFGASAIQVEHKGTILKHHRQSEDCLTLNIGVGEDKTESKRPVLVLFHGGDFTSGGSVDPLIYCNNFLTDHPETVFVSFNYRLGIFGFIDFSEVPGGEARQDTLNLGLLDQIAALKWIKENIGFFGGDPDRITVLGFESGASSILLLAASGQAKGLFRRAFIFNGSLAAAYDTPEASRNLAKDLLKETNTTTMTELLQLNTEVLKDAAQKLWQDMCAPACDGKLLSDRIYQAFEKGETSDIEFVIGLSGNETQVFHSLVGEEKYMEGISLMVSDMQKYLDKETAGAVQTYIDDQTAASTELIAKSKIIEQWNALCIYRSAVKLKEGGNNVHLMYWAEKALIESLGSGTVDVEATLLGNDDALQMHGSVMNKNLSTVLQTLLQKYIKGEPLELYRNEISGFDAMEWKAFPEALVVSDGKLCCEEIESRITEVKELLNFIKR